MDENLCSGRNFTFATIPASFALDVSHVKGIWKLDFDAFWKEMEKHPEIASMPGEQKAFIKPMMQLQIGEMRMVITDKTVGMSGGPGVYEYFDPKNIIKWESTGPKTASVTVDDEKNKEPTIMTLVDAKTLTLDLKKGKNTMKMIWHPDEISVNVTATVTK